MQQEQPEIGSLRVVAERGEAALHHGEAAHAISFARAEHSEHGRGRANRDRVAGQLGHGQRPLGSGLRHLVELAGEQVSHHAQRREPRRPGQAAVACGDGRIGDRRTEHVQGLVVPLQPDQGGGDSPGQHRATNRIAGGGEQRYGQGDDLVVAAEHEQHRGQVGLQRLPARVLPEQAGHRPVQQFGGDLRRAVGDQPAAAQQPVDRPVRQRFGNLAVAGGP